MNPFRVIIPTNKTAGISKARTMDSRIKRAQLRHEQFESGIGCIHLSGRLDILGVQQIELTFTVTISTQRKSIIVDLSDVELVSSVGLGLLIANANTLKGYGKMMILLKPNPRVERVIRIACLDQLLPVEYDLSEALRRISAAEAS